MFLTILQETFLYMTYKTLNPPDTTDDFDHDDLHAQFLNERALERDLESNIRRIPKITNYDGLEQVAQLIYHQERGQIICHVLRDDTHIFLDSPRASWQFPDMTIRQMIGYHFQWDNFVLHGATLDILASNAPYTIIHLEPIESDEDDWHDIS